MNGDSYNITVAQGGFIVHVNRPLPSEGPTSASIGGDYETRVFVDYSSLLNYLHNELAGSN